MLTLFIILIGAYLLGNGYIFLRGAQAVAIFPISIKVILALLYIGGALSFVGIFLWRGGKLPMELAHVIYEIGTGWLVFTLYMVIILLLFDLFRLFNYPCQQSFWFSLVLVISLLDYGNYRYQHPKTRVFNIVFNKLFNKGEPLKVVAVSDIHLGYGTGKQNLRRYVDMINALRPDLILIGGDLIDNSVTPLYACRMQEELAQLHAPQGIYMVPGNHEYHSDIRKSEAFLRETPIRLLRDEVIVLPSGIQLIGRDDRTNRHRRTLEALVRHADPTMPVILLDHQPYNLQSTEQAGIDLQFSGHTHHGQVFPLNLVTDRLFDQSYGYRMWGRSHIYVSSGLSLWGPPFRIGTDSELIVFNLTYKPVMQ